MWPEIAKRLCNTALGHMIQNVKPYVRHLPHASTFSMTCNLPAADDATNNPVGDFNNASEDRGKPKNIITVWPEKKQ